MKTVAEKLEHELHIILHGFRREYRLTHWEAVDVLRKVLAMVEGQPPRQQPVKPRGKR